MHELLTSAEMGRADAAAIRTGVSGAHLMEQAGHAVAERVLGYDPWGRIAVVAGPGNNGGDGFVAARHLAARGRDAVVLFLGDKARLKGDALQAAQRWQGPTEPATAEGLARAEVLVDALFGAGLDRPVTGAARAMIEAMNAAGVPIVAVDLPSGISGTTGQVMGAAVRARESVTFFRRKPGHVLLPGRQHCGHVHVVDIGIPAAVLAEVAPKTWLNGPALWGHAFPIPQIEGHKYARGHAVVVSGDAAHTGAARLAARGALRGGAGLVTLASPREALAINAAASLAVMVRPVDGADELTKLLADARLNAVVLGPGGGVGAAMRDMVVAALASDRAVVLDADALTSFPHPDDLFAAIRCRRAATVLTPHDGEFKRLFGGHAPCTDDPSKCERVRAAAALSGAVVVLKGADTVVAETSGRAAINDNAPPWLATAGAGDVLAGFIGGLLAQGMPAFDAACAGTWLQGAAGHEAGPGLISEDLPEAVPAVYRRLFAALSDTRAPLR